MLSVLSHELHKCMAAKCISETGLFSVRAEWVSPKQSECSLTLEREQCKSHLEAFQPTSPVSITSSASVLALLDILGAPSSSVYHSALALAALAQRQQDIL